MTTEATPDYSAMSDADLSAALSALDTAGDEAAPATAPEVEAPAPEKVEEAPDQAAQPEDPAASEEQPQDDKTERAVPVTEHQKMRQRAQEAERIAQEAQQQLAAIKAQQEANNLQAEYDRLYLEEGEAAAEQFRIGVVNQRQQQANQQAANTSALERIRMSREVLMDVHADYETQEAKVIAKYGLEEAQRLAARQANPAKWAYEEGKSIQTPEERRAAIEAEVSQRVKAEVKAALAKQSSPPPGRKSVGDLSSTRTAGVEKAAAEMSDDELAAREADLRAHWSD